MYQSSVPLDQEAIDLIAEMVQTIKNSETAISTVLAYFCRQQKIQGKVTLSPDRRSILVAVEEPPVPVPERDLEFA